MNKKGFTLIELLVVISIISLLSSVVISSMNKARTRGKAAAVAMSLHEVKNALHLYVTDKGTFPVVLNDLVVKGFIGSVSPDLFYSPFVQTDNLLICTVEPCLSYSLSAWQTVNNTMNLNLATSYCSSLGAGWRLPTREELVSSQYPLPDGTYWSSYPHPNFPSDNRYMTVGIPSKITLWKSITSLQSFSCVK